MPFVKPALEDNPLFKELDLGSEKDPLLMAWREEQEYYEDQHISTEAEEETGKAEESNECTEMSREMIKNSKIIAKCINPRCSGPVITCASHEFITGKW